MFCIRLTGWGEQCMTTPQATSIGLLKTVAACLLAPIVAAVGTAIASLLWLFLNFAFSFIPIAILGFFAGIFGAFAGMYAARAACDKFLFGYLPQAVFFVFALIIAFYAYMYIFLIPFEWIKLVNYGQVTVFAILSYVFFGKLRTYRKINHNRSSASQWSQFTRDWQDHMDFNAR